MSVSQTNVLMYGVRVPYSEYTKLQLENHNDDDWYDETTLGNRKDQNVGILGDGMNGEYCLVGRSLYDEDVSSDSGVAFKIDILSEADKVKIKEGIESLLGHEIDEMNYYFVCHYW